MFEIFARKKTLIATLDEINARGWKGKSWVTKDAVQRRGHSFNRHTLKSLLSNPLYVGKVRLKDELHDGEHPALIGAALWDKVTAALEANSRKAGAQRRTPLTAMLRGLLFCAACKGGCPSSPFDARTTRQSVARVGADSISAGVGAILKRI
jgi:site-specific DNA recombinase